MKLFEYDRQHRSAIKRDWLIEFINRSMILTDARIDAPRGSRIAINRVRDRPTLLVEIGSRVLDRQRLCIGRQ